MALPSFNDIGKKFKDLYGKQFPAGFWKCSAKLPEMNDISFNIDGSISFDSGCFSQNIEMKTPLKLGDTRISCTEKLTPKNELVSSFEIKPTDGLTQSVEFVLQTSTGQPSIKSKNSYKTEFVTATGDINFKSLKPELSFSFMTKLIQSIPLIGGGTISYDLQKNKITEIAYGIQIDRGDVCLSAKGNNKDFMSQIFMKISEELDVGFESGWNQDSKKAKFGGVTQLKLESGSHIKSKIESSGILSLGYTFVAIEGVKTTIGCKLYGNNLTGGNHEFGIQMEL